MRIISSPLYLGQMYNSIQQRQAFGIDATETNKMSDDIDRYQGSLVIFPEYMHFFLANIKDIANHQDGAILDVGSNRGDLTRNIRKKYPGTTTINMDLVPDFHKVAQMHDLAQGLNERSEYKIGNALSLPVEDNSLSAILYSRVLHEIYSYDCKELNVEKFSNSSVPKALEEAYKKLKPNGRVLIKDPAKPGDYDKLVKLQNFKDNKSIYYTHENLMRADVRKLDTFNLLKRFCNEFEPAKGNYMFSSDSCTMPKWLAAEFIRHRKFNDTKLHWQDEINERYGVMTNEEYKSLAQKIGYKVIKAEYNFKPDNENFYSIDNEFIIEDMNGNRLIQEKEFPVDQYLVLEK